MNGTTQGGEVAQIAVQKEVAFFRLFWEGNERNYRFASVSFKNGKGLKGGKPIRR